jgi:transglutaminase-like putative cysteine protease
VLASIAPLRAQDGPSPYFEDVVPQELSALIVPSMYRIPLADRSNTIEYRIRIEGDPEWYWPDTGEQRIAASGDDVVITICGDCGREAPPSSESLRRATLPTPWLQSDDPSLITFARRARGAGARRRMESLTRLVLGRMTGTVDYDRYLSARDAFDRRSGDCTEFALLLAALGRAKGIPTRVVAGLAYGSRFVGSVHAFAPHVWVQAWTGERWESFDAALQDFDSTHIALAVGDGSPESYARVSNAIARLRILDMQQFEPVETISSPPR